MTAKAFVLSHRPRHQGPVDVAEQRIQRGGAVPPVILHPAPEDWIELAGYVPQCALGPLAINVSPANKHDSKGIVPVLHQLAGRGFKGTALGDLSYRGERLSKAGEALGITIQPSAGGHGGTFIPEGTRWVVERSLAWISRYRRLNTIFERTEGHLVAFIEIAFISILSRRLVRLVTQEISA